MFKVFFFNVMLLLALLFLVVAMPAFIGQFEGDATRARKGKKEKLPNYAEIPWVKKYYDEFAEQGTLYYDYIGWRKKPYNGETITIDQDGYRTHSTKLAEAEAWFFGGSTMWGMGSNNENTIPALYQQITGIKSFNFGESGYTSHQSLNLFEKVLVPGNRPKQVFFYDGVNDVVKKCRTELNYFSAGYEMEFRQRIDSAHKNSFQYLFEPVIGKIAESFAGREDKYYDCDSKPEKTRNIALALYYDWEAASHLAKLHNAEFVPVLQPVAYQGQANLSHLPNTRANVQLAKQYAVVYEEIRKVMAEKKFPYYDMAKLFDGNEYFYIDFCHVSPNGNRKVANSLAGIVAKP